MIQEHTIAVEKSLRYAVREAEKSTDILLYVLHGYGQLGRYFLRKLETINPEKITIVAPEGTHRFYLNGHSGRVGASWMTKEARELDIAENTLALDRLHKKLSAHYLPSKIAVVGFSQGGATAARWVSASKCLEADLFVSWASVFPPDVKLPGNGTLANQNTFVAGSEDQFFPREALDEAVKNYREIGFDIQIFEGGHDINAAVLSELLSRQLD